MQLPHGSTGEVGLHTAEELHWRDFHGDLESTFLRGLPGMQLPHCYTGEIVKAHSRRAELIPENKI